MRSWRSIQLENHDCEQDSIILNFFRNKPVKYIGDDFEFAQKLLIDNSSQNIVAIYNSPNWLSHFIRFVQNLQQANCLYLGINRYVILGNDTNIKFQDTLPSGQILINLVGKVLPNFKIIDSGHHDNDQGRYFNFVQPLTWLYATNTSN